MVLLGDIGNIGLMALIGVVFTLPTVIVPVLFAPHKPNPIKNSTFESGQVPTGSGKMHYMMQYYAYLLMFVVFDVMVMFLYAWGAALLPLQLGAISGWVMTLFIGVLIVPMAFTVYLAGKREIW